MFDASIYGPAFLYIILVITISSFFIYSNTSTKRTFLVSYNKGMLWFLVIFMTLFLGTRPISGVYFVDMGTYAAIFEQSSITGVASFADPLFAKFVETSSVFLSTRNFFLLCTILYFLPITFAFKKIHASWAFVPVLAILGGFQGYPYIVNGIRNGIATSILLLAFAYWDRKLVMFALMAVALGTHQSSALPIIAFLLTGLTARPLYYGIAWAGAFIISAIGGAGFTQTLGSLISFGEDERLASYTSVEMFSMGKTGFRLDFIAYSIVPILITYFLAKDEVKNDKFYRRILCTYLLTNTFWLLVIYSEFSNRFAYLSWFMLPWVIIYPFIPLKNSPVLTPSKYLGPALMAHFGFLYFMYLFY